jgi:2-polyprenyl-6-methoxyphenol hydroxylase-like FAD-dependent oxidoreductase
VAREASVQLHTSSRVVDIDPASAQIKLADGTTIEGDVVLGADGVHSITRQHISGADLKPFSSGKSAFRFLVSKKEAFDDPITSCFVQHHGQLCIWYGTDRRVVMYPTSDNQMLNFVCIHPEAESESEAGSGWNQEGHVDTMLKVYDTFGSPILHLLGKADPNTIGVWTLLDMKVIPSWTTGRLALLGDAAHPFLPHQGQGAGVAIEDAAALAVVLPLGVAPQEVPERLKLYEDIRKERADRIQQYSRLAGKDLTEDEKTDSKCRSR